MREILFRGKTTETTDGRWIYGNYICAPGNTFVHSICEPDLPYDWYEIDIETIGFIDTNGKKIFEGDVVLYVDNDDDVCIVEYSQGAFWLSNHDIGYSTMFEPGSEYKIVGNIYDNSENAEVFEAQ